MPSSLGKRLTAPVRSTIMADDFQNWIPLKSASLGHFPRCGECSIVYVFRDSRDGEILKYGKTGCARDRIFKNYIGGSGGPTTKRIHDNLFADGMIEHVEIAWIETSDAAQAELREKRFRAEFVRENGHWPLWDLKD
jgi:hypothetical protein